MVSLVVPGFSKGEENQVTDLARAECHGANFCSVGIWTNVDLAPRTLKMTDAEAAGRLGHYVHNSKTGLDRILWNCALPRTKIQMACREVESALSERDLSPTALAGGLWVATQGCERDNLQ